MKIKVIFDKRSMDKKLQTGWGVSFLINGKILFDTAENGEWLIGNMRSLSVDMGKIEAVVISHDHWDHTGGLWEILKERQGVRVYACPGFSREFKDKVKAGHGEMIESAKFVEVSPGIYATGEVPGAYHGKYMPEQAVVLKTKNGLTVITGCAHPGVLKILEKVRSKFSGEPIYFVLGGFHLIESDERSIEIAAESFKDMNIVKAGPTHCSGDLAEDIFKRYYKKDFVSVKAGQDLEV